MPRLVRTNAKLYEFMETSAECFSKQETSENIFHNALSVEEAKRDSESARTLYEEALRYNPRNTSAMVNLGASYLDANQYEKAEQLFRKAIEIVPNYSLAHFNLASCLDTRGGRFKIEAIKHYLTALEINPLYVDAHFNIAASYEENCEFSKAIPHWTMYLKFDRDSEWADIARRCLRSSLQKTGFRIVPKPKAVETGKENRKEAV